MRPSLLSLFPLTITLLVASEASAQTRETTAESTPSIGYALRAGVEVGARWFVYSDPLVIATNLRPYDVVGVPLVTFGGALRPLGWSRSPLLQRLEISFDYAFAPTLDSSTRSGENVGTSWDHGDVIVHAPVRLGKHFPIPELGPAIGFGWTGFSFAASGRLATEVPTVTYRFVRIGVHGRMLVTPRWFVSAGFDYLRVVSGGSLYDRFRDPSVNGIDAKLGVGLNVNNATRLTLQLDYTRFFSSFVPVPGDAYVAGGALDEFGTVKIGIEYGR